MCKHDSDCFTCEHFIHHTSPSRTYCLKAINAGRIVDSNEEWKKFNSLQKKLEDTINE